MPGLIDSGLTRRVTFAGAVDSSWGTPNCDLLLLTVDGSPMFIEVVELYVALVGPTTIAANEHLGLTLHHFAGGTLTPGSAGGAPTKTHDYVNTLFSDQLGLGFISENSSVILDTFSTTSGTDFLLFADGWNIQIPYKQVWLEGDRPELACSSGSNHALVWRLQDSPSADVAIRGHVVYRAMDVQYD
jgi:hypothetical protein